jgi:hypothetical protein
MASETEIKTPFTVENSTYKIFHHDDIVNIKERNGWKKMQMSQSSESFKRTANETLGIYHSKMRITATILHPEKVFATGSKFFSAWIKN